MGTLTLWLGSHVPSAVQETVIAEATQQWPDIAWQIEQAHEVHGVWPGPTLALLAPDDPLPPLDPAEGAVVWILEHEASPSRPLALASTLRAHIGRLIAPRQGEPPPRAYVLPTHLSRAALLRLPRPVPQPLPRVPRVSADGCLHAQGCRCQGQFKFLKNDNPKGPKTVTEIPQKRQRKFLKIGKPKSPGTGPRDLVQND